MTNIELRDKSYSWKGTTLSEFLGEGNIPGGWRDFFHISNVRESLANISSELAQKSRILYPPLKDVLVAFYMTPLDTFKVVLLGQDPYHSGTDEFDGSAMGLAFSVRSGNPTNPPLKNIYKELATEGFSRDDRNGDLREWTSHTLLLNTALTVVKGEAGSHSCL
jgi:uracil-DNA glycosylase